MACYGNLVTLHKISIDLILSFFWLLVKIALSLVVYHSVSQMVYICLQLYCGPTINGGQVVVLWPFDWSCSVSHFRRLRWHTWWTTTPSRTSKGSKSTQWSKTCGNQSQGGSRAAYPSTIAYVSQRRLQQVNVYGCSLQASLDNTTHKSQTHFLYLFRGIEKLNFRSGALKKLLIQSAFEILSFFFLSNFIFVTFSERHAVNSIGALKMHNCGYTTTSFSFRIVHLVAWTSRLVENSLGWLFYCYYLC